MGGSTGAVCTALDATLRGEVLLAASSILRGIRGHSAQYARSTHHSHVTHSDPTPTGRDWTDRTSCRSCDVVDDSIPGLRAGSVWASTKPWPVRDRCLCTRRYWTLPRVAVHTTSRSRKSKPEEYSAAARSPVAS